MDKNTNVKTMNIYEIIDKAYDVISNYDFTSLLNKIKELVYIIPIPTNFEDHTIENWYELNDDEELHWKIPSIDVIKHIFVDLIVQSLCDKSDVSLNDFVVLYNNANPIIDESSFDKELNELTELQKEYEYDHKYVLPEKTYVGNCSKEFCEKIVDKFWEREYERIQYIDFPPTAFTFPTLDKCKTEFKNLVKNEGSANNKNTSNIIKYFHKSIIFANVHDNLSPYDGWQSIKSDPEKFKSFYRNRLRCSDWFKVEGRLNYLLRGVVMENTYGVGLSTSRMFQSVTYFKPKFAKYIIQKYLNDYNTVFDPFSGYSGRLIGCLAANKNYIGQDLCESTVKESNEVISFLSGFTQNTAVIQKKDTLKEYGEYDCLFTCSPYNDIEKWPGVKSENYSCDKWIDVCLCHYKCNRYVFVTDDKIDKYKKYVKEEIVNTSHFKANKEYVVVINKEDFKDIKFDIDGNFIENDWKGEYSKLGESLYNIFNQKIFNHYIDCPVEMHDYVNLIYDKFEQKRPIVRNIKLTKIKLVNNSNDVLLACSCGLDSIYQIFQLRQMGYNPILYHMKNANRYENVQSYKSLCDLSQKLNIRLVVSELKYQHTSNYQKYWAENPIKNQMMILDMIDWCHKNNVNKICMDGSWEFSIDEVTAGVDVADAPENYDLLIKFINKFVANFEFIKTPHLPKIEKLNYLKEHNLDDYIYSCLGPGKFNEYRHNECEKKYGIKLFKHNCGHSCRKCAHHNLLRYYENNENFPQEFIDKCWKIMSNNSYASRNMLFGNNIPLEQKIKNLYVE